MSERIWTLDFQIDERIIDTEWKWNIVSEEMEKKFEIFYSVSNERLIKAGPTIWTVLNAALQYAERDAQARQRRQRSIDYSL